MLLLHRQWGEQCLAQPHSPHAPTCRLHSKNSELRPVKTKYDTRLCPEPVAGGRTPRTRRSGGLTYAQGLYVTYGKKNFWARADV